MRFFRYGVGGVAASAGGGGAYGAIANQLVRINGVEGSFSGTDPTPLTSVTDVSGVGATFALNGSPGYNSADPNYNNQPSCQPLSVSNYIRCDTVNMGDIAYIAIVAQRLQNQQILIEQPSGAVKNISYWGGFNLLRIEGVGSQIDTTIGGTALNGVFRLQVPLDGVGNVYLNGVSQGPVSADARAHWDGIGAGFYLMTASAGGASAVPFFMASSSIPSDAEMMALDAQLVTDYV